MHKIFFLFSILLATSVPLMAQPISLNVNLQDGGKASFPISKISKITFDNITGIQDAKQFQNIVQKLTLFQNYPNPFNPTTTIRYETPEAGMANIKIFDSTGRLVRSFSHYTAKAGMRELNWNGKNDSGHSVASGQYFYQVRFADMILTKRMLFIK